MTDAKPINSQDHCQTGLDAELERQNNEMRGEFRLTGRVFVDLLVATDDNNITSPEQTWRCATADLSASGLRIYTPGALTPNALLSICVHDEWEKRDYPLVIEVVWCRPVDDPAVVAAGNAFLVGLRIIESDDTAVLEWKEAVVRWLTAA